MVFAFSLTDKTIPRLTKHLSLRPDRQDALPARLCTATKMLTTSFPAGNGGGALLLLSTKQRRVTKIYIYVICVCVVLQASVGP